MAVSEARKKANMKFDAKTYTKITFRYRNEVQLKERIKRLGYTSVNKYILDAVLHQLEEEESILHLENEAK